MERNLRRCKLNSFPSSPINGTGVIEAFRMQNVNQSFGLSRHDVPNQFYKGTSVQKNFECTFFASESIINNITANIPKGKRHYFLDATFKVVPFGSFKQLLILYVEYIGKVLLMSFHSFKYIFLIRKLFGYLTGLSVYICSNE